MHFILYSLLFLFCTLCKLFLLHLLLLPQTEQQYFRWGSTNPQYISKTTNDRFLFLSSTSPRAQNAFFPDHMNFLIPFEFTIEVNTKVSKIINHLNLFIINLKRCFLMKLIVDSTHVVQACSIMFFSLFLIFTIKRNCHKYYTKNREFSRIADFI